MNIKKTLSKWRFLIFKFIWLKLIRLNFANDFYIKIRKDHILQSSFVMRSCNFRDQVACNILKYGWENYESPMGLLIAYLCRNQKVTFVDIGANTGFYSLLASASGAHQVIGFEPIPYISGIYIENVHLSGMSNLIEVNQMAISDSTGTVNIYLPEGSEKYIETSASLDQTFRSGEDLGSIVRAISLNDFGSHQSLKSLTSDGGQLVLKIDVESYELQVLLGAGDFFKIYQPTIFIELLKQNLQRNDIYNLIISQGYRCLALSERNFQIIDSLDGSESSHDNYLFIHSSRLTDIVSVVGRVLVED